MSNRITFGLTVLFSLATQAVVIAVLAMGIKGFEISASRSTIYFIGLFLSLTIAYYLVLKTFEKLDVINRLPTNVPSKNLLLIGGILVLLPSILHIFAAMVPGGGVSFGLAQITSPFVSIGYILLFLGTAKLLLAMKPHESYKYNSVTSETV